MLNMLSVRCCNDVLNLETKHGKAQSTVMINWHNKLMNRLVHGAER